MINESSEIPSNPDDLQGQINSESNYISLFAIGITPVCIIIPWKCTFQ